MPLTKINTRSLSGSLISGQVPATDASTLPAGTIVQTQIATTNTEVTSSSNSAYNATGLIVSITPTSTSNRLHIHFDAKSYMNNTSVVSAFNYCIYRKIGSGSMSPWKAGSGWDHYMNTGSYSHDFYPHVSYIFFDSPNTTQQVQYEIYIKSYGASGGTVTAFSSNMGTIGDSGYSPGMSAMIDRGTLIAQEIKL